MLRYFFVIFLALVPSFVLASPKAEIVMDLRNGSLIHQLNADDRIHPASLTKLMTLYVTFNALARGDISLSDTTTVSEHAASRPPSSMNLKKGQSITIADLIRGVAVQSANDGASALAEAVGGSESGFVRMMNETAQRMGLENTQFQNPHGLTHAQQLVSARDIATLAWRMYHDHRGHYGLFSQSRVQINGQRFLSTNRRFLSGYQGATGLKTGYTRAAGYNLAATSERNGVPLLTVVMGASSSPERFERTVALMNWGYAQVDNNVARVTPPPLGGEALSMAPRGIAEHQPLRAALNSQGGTAFVSDIVQGHSGAERTQPQTDSLAYALPPAGGFRPIRVALAGEEGKWGVQIGLFPSQYHAEQELLRTTLDYIDRFGSVHSSVISAGQSWSAAYTHMSRRQAETACRNLIENGKTCAIFKYDS